MCFEYIVPSKKHEDFAKNSDTKTAFSQSEEDFSEKNQLCETNQRLRKTQWPPDLSSPILSFEIPKNGRKL